MIYNTHISFKIPTYLQNYNRFLPVLLLFVGKSTLLLTFVRVLEGKQTLRCRLMANALNC